ncbi:hypothetical protein GGTG_11735 [Gaeumannomyces tritici R3-111a-1]|uniref:C3H1-type domain-containing protein n=1 Tax=Gaeumannomyces tritici (strain R3-111a-1) TaxID=644352 RepID=J3PE12_GAET3|nr:hypothetical protein GGTG_11735 [Gaeumannomyces tritici R3-111a-1]EJT70712.1 hypothetical protein GGTG_11735 [Gaeumannomyces tritici R3-111a-1]
MSYYPAGYGQWPDPASYSPFSQTPQPMGQSSTQRPPPTYNYPPSTPTGPGPYTASQAAFAHNATHIPGLGVPGAGSPSHYQGPWQPALNFARYGQQIATPQKPPPQSLPAAAVKATTSSTPKPPNDVVEEGELEEEDFDDLYEPHPSDNAPKFSEAPRTTTLGQPKKGNRDAQAGAFYEAELGEVVSNRGGSPGRERSGSYSPHLSPREIDLEAGTSHKTSDGEVGRAQQTYGSQRGALPAKHVTNGAHAPNDPSSLHLTAATTSDAPSISAPGFRSADEAKKEAQKSILRLLPLGVKFQNYIDEGFDETIVKSLFGDLNLLPPVAPAKPSAQSPQTKQPAATEASDSTSAKPKDQAEERKDRIARLLAAKAAKTAATALPALTSPTAHPPKPAGAASAPGAPSAPLAPSAMAKLPPPSAPTGPAALQNFPPPSAPTGPAAMQNLPPASAPTGPAALRKDAGSSPASKPRSKTDKEQLLKKKTKALLKARQAQAQQSVAAASAAFKPHTPAALGQPSKDANADTNVSLPEKPPAPIAPPASEAPAVPNAQPAPSVASPSPMSSRAESAIPGLYLSTSVGSTQTSRKRPVAADFVDYNTSVGTPKRPFGQNRQDSFVINISEDEESDEDIEMEVDSPAAGSPSSSSQQVDTPGRKGPSIKDFAPLSDGPYKRPLSRTSSSGPRPAKLHQLSGEISSLQRKIAELEAKKAKKSSSGAHTPSVAAGTPIEFPESVKGLAPDPRNNTAQTHTKPRGVASASEVDNMDLASAQLISEAASATLPHRAAQPKNAGKAKSTYGELGELNAPRPIHPRAQPGLSAARVGSEDDRRARIASIQLPKIEATLLEKKTKLKLLEQKTNQLRLEIEREAAEKEKLAEELRLLDQAESAQPTSASGEPELAIPSVVTHESTAAPSQTGPRAGEDSLASTTEHTKDSQQIADDGEDSTSSADDDAAATQSMDLDDEDASTPDSTSNPPEQTDQVPPVPVQTNTESSPASGTAAADAVSLTPATEANVSPNPASQPPAPDEKTASEASTPESGQVDESEPEQPSSAPSQTSRLPNELDAEVPQQDDDAAEVIVIEDGSPAPAMISDVAEPSSNEMEQAQELGNGECPSRRNDVQLTSFTPYESPLKNFRSYRFHPEYANNVQGGLKSLTYTNKINPNQELCPDEITRGRCDDKTCRFQHFASMKPKDDYILIELGRADEFAEGEEKNKFIGGLRDLLLAFRTEKVRDYDKIGYGIIEYRRKFIGDKSRVLSGLHNTKI